MHTLGAIGHFIITPLYYIISVPLVGWHALWGAIFGPTSGASWALSIIGLTVVIRAALIPLFVKQIKSSRNMQLIQPKVKELQKKYGHDREKLAQETMKLYKDTGTNPFASCLPILIQMPIFLTLFRLIDHAAKQGQGNGILTDKVADQLQDAKLFDVIKVSSSFTHSDGLLSVKILAGFLVLAMTATTFLTQRQLMSKNMPSDALSGPYAQQQKLLLYVLPVVFAVGGIAFPIGVLLYWTTSNLWTMCQQFYVIRNNPAPGTPAAKAKAERERKMGREPGEVSAGTDAAGTLAVSDARRPAQRVQPKKQTREQRKTTTTRPGGGTNGMSPATPQVGNRSTPAKSRTAADLEPADPGAERGAAGTGSAGKGSQGKGAAGNGRAGSSQRRPAGKGNGAAGANGSTGDRGSTGKASTNGATTTKSTANKNGKKK